MLVFFYTRSKLRKIDFPRKQEVHSFWDGDTMDLICRVDKAELQYSNVNNAIMLNSHTV